MLVILLGLNWTACMTVKGRDPDGVWVQYTGVWKYYSFDDVLIPKELKCNSLL